MNYSAVAKRLQDNQNIPAEEKEQTFKILNEATKIQIDTIDEAITNKYEKSIAKMGLAYAISPFIETLNNYDEE